MILSSETNKYDVDFSDVRGQENVKRALEVAAAGGHNIIILYTILLLKNSMLYYCYSGM